MILVVGASGATGQLLIEQLLRRGHKVKAIIRESASFPTFLRENTNIQLIQANLLDLDDQALSGLLKDCAAIASCLGHNMSFKGMYGKPRRLVTDAVRRLCQAAIALNQQSPANELPIKFCLMNSSGVVNHKLNEKVSIANKVLTGLIRALVPPHSDNEEASAYLQNHIGVENPQLQWVAVRPDGLIDEVAVSEYQVFPSPIRDPILNSGKTSRINVAAFMAKLLSDDNLWDTWQGQTPVIYNADFASPSVKKS